MFDDPELVLEVEFFRSAQGREPVREWLKSLEKEDRTTIGEDLRTVQFGWPLGMPLVRKLKLHGSGTINGDIARVFQEVSEDSAPRVANGDESIETLFEGGRNMRKNKHRGSSFDDFLREEGILDHVNEVATKRVLAFLIEREMKRQRLTKSKLAAKLQTSRAALDRLLDPDNNSVTLHTLQKTASALGKRLKIQLV